LSAALASGLVSSSMAMVKLLFEGSDYRGPDHTAAIGEVEIEGEDPFATSPPISTVREADR